MSMSLRPHELQHVRLPCPSPSSGVCSNSCPLSQRYHPTISSSVVPFSSPSIFPSIRVFPMGQFFPSGGQSIGASASASVLPMSIQGWFPLGWIGWIFLQSKGLSRVFSNTTVQKHQFFRTQPSLWSKCHIHTEEAVRLQSMQKQRVGHDWVTFTHNDILFNLIYPKHYYLDLQFI